MAIGVEVWSKKNRPTKGAAIFKPNTNYTYYLFVAWLPNHTFFPCIALPKYMIPTNKKKSGPVKPNKAIYFVP